jgi:hypothetical protein
MNLAEIIYKALTDQQFRLALESGTANGQLAALTVFERDAISEVLRRFKHASTKTPLADLCALNPIPNWREE